MRTQDEIKTKAQQVMKSFMGSMTWEDFLPFMTHATAKEFLKPEITKEMWEELRTEYTPENVKTAMQEYMEFAVEKAENQRGISAGRSIAHYQNWLWLLGEDELAEEIENYSNYGIAELKRIQEFLDKETPNV